MLSNRTAAKRSGWIWAAYWFNSINIRQSGDHSGTCSHEHVSGIRPVDAPPGSFCRTCRNLTRSRGGESSMGFLFTANDRFAEVAVAPRMSPVGRELSASTRWPGFSAYDAPDPHRSAVTIRYWERQIRLLRGFNCWQASKYRQELKSCDCSSYGPNRAKSRSSNSQFAGHMTLHPALVDHPSRLRVLLRHP